MKNPMLALLAAAALAIAAVPSTAHDGGDRDRDRGDWESDRNSVVGVWDLVVTLRVPAADCTTAAVVGVGPNPFPQYYTFHRGGTLSEWGTRAPPSTRGSGHGIWKRVGHDQYKSRLQFHSFDANGLFNRTMDIVSDISLAKDGETLKGVSRFTFTDLSGNALRFCATMEGTRLSLP